VRAWYAKTDAPAVSVIDIPTGLDRENKGNHESRWNAKTLFFLLSQEENETLTIYYVQFERFRSLDIRWPVKIVSSGWEEKKNAKKGEGDGEDAPPHPTPPHPTPFPPWLLLSSTFPFGTFRIFCGIYRTMFTACLADNEKQSDGRTETIDSNIFKLSSPNRLLVPSR